jgi:phage gp46-like protein
MIEAPCLDQNVGRRRIFWTTRQGVCGTYVLCGNECQIPGLEYEDHEDPYLDQSPPPGSRGYRTIKNDEWLLGLILNILNTRARTDLNCPSPAAVYGHWSESYREDGLWIGSRLWNAADKSYARTSDAVKAIEAAIKADMAKLVMMGVADSVEVEATYRRHSTVEVIVTAIKTNARHVLNLSGTFVSDTWVWH